MNKENKIAWIIGAGALVLFLGIILGPYYKPPWPEDHLVYTVMSGTEDFDYFKYWSMRGLKMGEGNFSERLTVLYSIRFLTPFFSNPAQASTAAIILVMLSILGTVAIRLYKKNGIIAMTLGLIFNVFILYHIRMHATEVLADPYGTLFIFWGMLVFWKKKENSNWRMLFFSGFLFWCAIASKIHYGFFAFLITVYMLYKKNVLKTVVFVSGGLSGLLVFLGLFYFLYPEDFFIKYLMQTKELLLTYFTGGLQISSGGFLGYFDSWLYVLFNQHILPSIFLVPLLFSKFNRRSDPFWQVLGFGFLFLIFCLTIFSRFPANEMYGFASWVFIPTALASSLGEILKGGFESLNDREKYSLKLLLSCLLVFILALWVAPFIRFKFSWRMVISINVFVLLSLAVKRKKIFSLKNVVCIVSIALCFFMTTLNYSKYHSWKKGYNNYYELLAGVEEAYIKKGPVLTFFKPIDKRGRGWKYIMNILAAKVYPCPKIESVVGSEDELKKVLKDVNRNIFRTIITDNLEVIEKEFPRFKLETKSVNHNGKEIYYLSRK
ncbi:MAG: hypothetical protein H6621_04605 [Halobacteriovoraceae bacterium]|nr:hypothetical protein [Halobacteriovoraceae bacterium]